MPTHATIVILLALLAAAMLTGCAATPPTPSTPSTPTGTLFATVADGSTTRPYAVFVPRDYAAAAEPWPVIVFLNGSGECGTDGQRQLTQGLYPAMINDPKSWPFIAVFPQKPERDPLWRQYDGYVMACLRDVQAKYRTDPARVYLTGLSQGGGGTWSIASLHPEVFAAAAPVCGINDPKLDFAAFRNLPVWAFHGGKDDVVKPEVTTRIAESIRAAGGEVEVTIYPDLNHGCWDRTYRDMKLGAWLLKHRRAESR